jgi:hypothetical protein
MDYPILKKLKLQGDYQGMVNDVATWDEYEVPIYDIPINKKNYCRPFTQMETKDGIRNVPACANFNKANSCNVCVNTAKQIAKMNK